MFGAGSEMSFNHPETFFSGRMRLFSIWDTFWKGRDWSFIYLVFYFTCRNRLYNVSGGIHYLIAGINNYDGFLMSVSGDAL